MRFEFFRKGIVFKRMRISDCFKKIFTGGEWFIAYKKNGTDDAYVIAEAPIDQWCADPFLLEDNDEHYIFCEQYRKDLEKGSIGYFQFENGVPVNKGIIIDAPYHMSYPCVFKYENQYFMIPESSANQSIDLYVAEEFPQKWRLEKTLWKGERYVDSTVLRVDDTFYLLSYKKEKTWHLSVFLIDMQKLELHRISDVEYLLNVGRPAGFVYSQGGKMYRPAQDCRRKYGEQLLIYAVDELNAQGCYHESLKKEISVRDFRIPVEAERIHTFNQDSTYSVIDVYREKTDLLHVIKILLRMWKK